jgi:hypothetical protein|tara:strand:- start:140 stop:313 length:174 start_codon:yes stop_codon:yes gene_type:complete
MKKGGNMKVGDLVRGNTNEMMGIVTTGGNLFVMVYWIELGIRSSDWIRTDGLEALCK